MINFHGLGFSDIVLILILSLVPSIVMLFLILYSDRKSREPLILILICLFSGIFTICLSLLLGQIILPSLNVISTGLFDSTSFNLFRILILAMIEEYSKLFVLYIFISHNSSFDDIYDGFVYSAIIALSFAAMETLVYVFNEQTLNEMSSLAVLRDFTTIPLHLVCGIIMGYYVAIEKFSKNKVYKVRKIAKSLLIPTFIHTIYNSFFSFFILLFKDSQYFLIIMIIFVLSIYSIGIIYIIKTRKLNDIFIKSDNYPKKYNYLMNRKEYINQINDPDVYNYQKMLYNFSEGDNLWVN